MIGKNLKVLAVGGGKPPVTTADSGQPEASGRGPQTVLI